METGEEGDAAGADADAVAGGIVESGPHGVVRPDPGKESISHGSAVDKLISLETITQVDILTILELHWDSQMQAFAACCREREPGLWKVKALHLGRQISTTRFSKLSGGDLRDDGLSNVVSLFEDGYFSDIRELRISMEPSRVSRTSIERFTHILSILKDLQILHICFYAAHEDAVGGVAETLAIFWESFARAMLSNTCLKELDVMGYGGILPGDSQCEPISAVFCHLCSLRVLRLSGLRIGCDGARNLSQTFRCDACEGSRIESIDLSTNSINRTGANSLGQALGSGYLKSLKVLKLYGNNLSEPKSSNLGSFCALDSVENILDGGFVSLAEFFQCDHVTVLEHLDLEETRINDRDISDLAKAMELGKLPKLRNLYLSGNSYTNMGLAALVEGFKSGNMELLQRVRLGGSQADGARNYGPDYGLIFQELADVLAHNKLPCLNEMRCNTPNKVSGPARQAMVSALMTAFTRNPRLTATCSIMGVGDSPKFLAELAKIRKRQNMMIQLAGEDDVLGRHGKLFFCGDPRVGKTTLRMTFCNKSSPDQQERTRGIEVTDFPGKATGVTLALWDLAGQHDFEVLHSAFLPDLNFAGGQATFFVIVCDARDINKGKQELQYWMRFISSNSVKDIQVERRRRVFVVLNCFHGHVVPERELQRWRHFLKQCSGNGGFKAYLNLHEDPFIADVKDKMHIRDFKRKVFNETKDVLQTRLMPQICQSIQQHGRAWAKSKENENYPVLQWDEFESFFDADGSVGGKKLRAATEYLHEAGHVILFKTAASSSTSSEWEGELFVFEGGLVILKPEWFCKQVVGSLLLPADILDQLSDVLDFESEKEGAVQIMTLAKAEFRVPKDKIDEVVRMMCRLGICYQLPGRSDIIYVPALMENSDMPGWSLRSWNGVTDPGAWVMGFALKVKNPMATLLPINVLAQLQVTIALDVSIGQTPQCDFLTRKNSVSFKFKKMHVLIEYSAQKQERMDVLVKPFVRNFSRKEQINVAQVFVSRITEIAEECARGVEFEKQIVRPWSVAAGWVEMVERKIDMRVDSAVKKIQERGHLQMLELAVDGEPVGEDDVLSDDDLPSFLTNQGHVCHECGSKLADCPSRTNLGDEESTTLICKDQFCKLLHCVQEVNNNMSIEFANSKAESSRLGVEIIAGIREVGSSVGELKQSESRIIAQNVESTQSMKRSFCQHMEDSERRIKARVAESSNQVKSRISTAIAESKQSLSLQLQNVLLEDREASVPRFVYVTEAREGRRKWLLNFTRVMAKPLVLQFLCEASYNDGNIHEVATQGGIDVRKLEDWAKKLLPMVAWTLKVVGMVGNIADKVLFPGLDLAAGADRELSRILGNVGQIAEGVAEFLGLSSDMLDSFASGQDLLPSSSGPAPTRWIPGTEKQLRGDAVKYLKGVRKKMEKQLRGDAVKYLKGVRKKMEKEGTWSQMSLQRLRLERSHQGGRKDLVWICSNCYECYKRDNPDSIQDAPV